MSRAIVTLTPYESRRLIGKAVAQLEPVKKAMEDGYIVIATSISTAYVAEELLGKEIDKAGFTIGISAKGRLCLTAEKPKPIVLKEGEIIDAGYEILQEFGPEDVFIKGANAIDPEGNVGVFVATPKSGTIGATINYLIAKGSHIIIPIGLEKLVPYPIDFVARFTGIDLYSYGTGMFVSLFPIPRATPITEIEAYKILANVDAFPIGAGGVDGSEGSITLVLDGEREEIEKAWEITKGVKGEGPLVANLMKCENCPFNCGVKV